MQSKTTFAGLTIRVLITALTLITFKQTAGAQIFIQGTAHDRTGGNPLAGVSVLSVKGYGTSTDSAGHYSIKLATTDSVYFSWLGKTTNRFAVKEIPANEPFDLNFDEVSVRSLPAYSVVGAKDYVQDSLNNREQYKKLFGYEGKDGVQDRTNPGGTAGLSWDLDNMLSPSADNRKQVVQQRIQENERDKYIDHKFNRSLVKRITHLESPALERFMEIYRPSYGQLQTYETEYEYYQWISAAGKAFEKDWEQNLRFEMMADAAVPW